MDVDCCTVTVRILVDVTRDVLKPVLGKGRRLNDAEVEDNRVNEEGSDVMVLVSDLVEDACPDTMLVFDSTGIPEDELTLPTKFCNICSISSSRASTAFTNCKRSPGKSDRPSWIFWISSMAPSPAVIGPLVAGMIDEDVASSSMDVGTAACRWACEWR
jgi:hypothetical protein